MVHPNIFFSNIYFLFYIHYMSRAIHLNKKTRHFDIYASLMQAKKVFMGMLPEQTFISLTRHPHPPSPHRHPTPHLGKWWSKHRLGPKTKWGKHFVSPRHRRLILSPFSQFIPLMHDANVSPVRSKQTTAGQKGAQEQKHTWAEGYCAGSAD